MAWRPKKRPTAQSMPDDYVSEQMLKDEEDVCEILAPSPRLYLSSYQGTAAAEKLRRCCVSHVLSIGYHLVPKHPDKFTFKNVEVDDSLYADLLTELPHCCAYIDVAQNSGTGGCLVHCERGRSRSATVVVAYCMLRKGMRVGDAWEHVRRARPVVCPNGALRRQLLRLDAICGGDPPADLSGVTASPLYRLHLREWRRIDARKIDYFIRNPHSCLDPTEYCAELRGEAAAARPRVSPVSAALGLSQLQLPPPAEHAAALQPGDAAEPEVAALSPVAISVSTSTDTEVLRPPLPPSRVAVLRAAAPDAGGAGAAPAAGAPALPPPDAPLPPGTPVLTGLSCGFCGRLLASPLNLHWVCPLLLRAVDHQYDGLGEISAIAELVASSADDELLKAAPADVSLSGTASAALCAAPVPELELARLAAQFSPPTAPPIPAGGVAHRPKRSPRPRAHADPVSGSAPGTADSSPRPSPVYDAATGAFTTDPSAAGGKAPPSPSLPRAPSPFLSPTTSGVRCLQCRAEVGVLQHTPAALSAAAAAQAPEDLELGSLPPPRLPCPVAQDPPAALLPFWCAAYLRGRVRLAAVPCYPD